MVYTRRYDFVPGTRISSSQVDEEFNYLISAANNLEASDAQKAPKSQAQMYKITPDDGGIKYVLGGSGYNLTASISGNLATFYSNKDTIFNPDKKTSFRGVYISDSPLYGELLALGNDQSVWRNSKVNGVWQGWIKTLDFRDFSQEELWSGVAYMTEDQTLTPSKKLWDCRNGWLLVWSDYDYGVGHNDFNWAFSYIPKSITSIDKGGTVYVPIVNNMSDTAFSITGKALYFNNEIVVGSTHNAKDATNTRDVVLRKIYEF